MLNRKENKLANRARHKKQALASKAPPARRRRFVLSARAHARSEARNEPTRKNGVVHEKNGVSNSESLAKAAYANSHPTTPGIALSQPPDLTTVIKNLVQLAREQGHLTFDDINDILPDGLSPDDLDELYTKLRDLDIEIVDQADVGAERCRSGAPSSATAGRRGPACTRRRPPRPRTSAPIRSRRRPRAPT